MRTKPQTDVEQIAEVRYGIDDIPSVRAETHQHRAAPSLISIPPEGDGLTMGRAGGRIHRHDRPLRDDVIDLLAERDRQPLLGEQQLQRRGVEDAGQ